MGPLLDSLYGGAPGRALCDHRRAVERALPIPFSSGLVSGASVTVEFDRDGQPVKMPFALDSLSFSSVRTARWCPDCRAALTGPEPTPLEELELTALALSIFGLSSREVRSVDVSVSMRLAGGFFAGGRPRGS